MNDIISFVNERGPLVHLQRVFTAWWRVGPGNLELSSVVVGVGFFNVTAELVADYVNLLVYTFIELVYL